MTNKFKYFLLFVLLIPCWVIASHYNVDLVNLYAAAQYVTSDLSRVYAQNGNLGRYFWGPFSLILIKPLGLFPFEIIKWFWICLQTVCYVVFWKALQKLYPFMMDNKIFWGWLLVFIIAINPIHNNYQSNNIQLMLATLLILAESWSRETSSIKQFLGGVLAVIAAAIKVFPLFIVAYYFLFKSSQVRKGILLASAFVLIAPLLFFGPVPGMTLYREWYLNLTTYGTDNDFSKVPDLLCLPSLLGRLGYSSIAIKVTILGLSALFFSWVAYRRKDLKQSRLNLHYAAVAWALCVFLNPSTRPHYFIFYLPAFCSLLEIIYSVSVVADLTLGVVTAMLLIAFTAEGIVGKKLNDTLEFKSYPTYGTILLCLFLIYGIRKMRKELPRQSLVTQN